MIGRSYITSFLMALFISVPSLSQNKDSLNNNNNADCYQIVLPKEWTQPRLIKAIKEILTSSFSELKNSDFHKDCKANYYLRLIIDSITINNQQNSLPFEMGSIPRYTYTFSFKYGLAARLVIFDSLQHPIIIFSLIGGKEIFTYSKDYTLPSQGSGSNFQYKYDKDGKIVNDKSIVMDTKPANTNPQKHNALSTLTYAYLLELCEQRIFAIRKKLKNNEQVD